MNSRVTPASRISHKKKNSTMPSSSALMLYTQKNNRESSENKDQWDAGSVDGYPWLFIGSLSSAESHSFLGKHNITRVLTVARRLPVKALPTSSSIIHKTVEIDDHPKANFLSEDVVIPCCEFINDAFEDYKKHTSTTNASHSPPPAILVHCASGISRSSTAVLCWLLTKVKEPNNNNNNSSSSLSLSLDEALKKVRKNRSAIHPNIGFMMQLQILEKYNGDLRKAEEEWNQQTNDGKVDLYDLICQRRQRANELHAEVDEIEVKVQRYQSSNIYNNSKDEDEGKQNESIDNIIEKEKKSEEETVYSLCSSLNTLSHRLDEDYSENAIGTSGLPEDRVTKLILKSARAKVERLLTLLDNSK